MCVQCAHLHGFHVYQDVWRPVIEELIIRCQMEEAVVIIKPHAGIVGHVPCYLSALSVFSHWNS